MNSDAYRIIQDFLRQKLTPVYIIVFGSFARNTAHQTSDIDIAFYSHDDSISSYDIFIMAQELADILKKEVDLIDLRTASTVFKAQIYTDGITIYSDDDLLLKEQQMLALSMYAKLNENRAPVLKKIAESGSVYEK